MRLSTAVAGLLLVLTAVPAFAQDIYSKSFKGQTPPPIKAKAEDWLNTKKPILPKDLKGKVVWLGWLDFYNSKFYQK